MADRNDFDRRSWDNRQGISRRPRDTADYGGAGMDSEDYAFSDEESDELYGGRQRYYFGRSTLPVESPQRESNRMTYQRDQDDWARQVRQTWQRGPYRDYGWESGESVLPEFRDPSVRSMPYEEEAQTRQRSGERRADFRQAYDYENAPRMPSGQVQRRFAGGPGYGRQGWYTAGPYAGRGPRNYQRSNERILEDVNERLTQHGQIDATDIQVRVEMGEVWLTGDVDSRRTKRMAEDVADSVPGVRDVHNELHVRGGSAQSPTSTSS